MKKIIMLIIAVFLVTGCSVRYDLTINEDLTVIEEAKLTGTSDFFSNYYKSTKSNVIKSFLDVYKDTLDENKYTYEFKEAKTPYVIVTRKFDSVNDYINNSKLFNDYFEKIDYTENGDIKKIETIGYNENDPDDPNRFYVRELEIAIKCPFKVKNHNAESVDIMTNTYYYKLSEQNSYKILLEYDASTKFNPNSDLIRMILLCIIIIIGSWVLIIVVNKNNAKNK